MKKPRSYYLVLPLLALLAPTALAQNSTSKPETAAPDQDVAYIRLSAEMASAARAVRDPVLMVSAAILEQMAATQDAPRGKTARSESEATEVEEKPQAASLFDLAEEYAGSNEGLLALVEESKARAATMKGRARGAFVHYDRVFARDTDVYREVYRAREFAEICLVGDGDTDLDLYIYDEYGNLICSSTGFTDREYCGWTPRWRGVFEIVVENLGSVYNDYRLVGN